MSPSGKCTSEVPGSFCQALRFKVKASWSRAVADLAAWSWWVQGGGPGGNSGNRAGSCQFAAAGNLQVEAGESWVQSERLPWLIMLRAVRPLGGLPRLPGPWPSLSGVFFWSSTAEPDGKARGGQFLYFGAFLSKEWELGKSEPSRSPGGAEKTMPFMAAATKRMLRSAALAGTRLLPGFLPPPLSAGRARSPSALLLS